MTNTMNYETLLLSSKHETLTQWWPYVNPTLWCVGPTWLADHVFRLINPLTAKHDYSHF